ncbi:MAG: hypothetical protein DVB32_08745 [Verrucomicrobia bacterium]|nr:MAG: hypothetical protein DVB32_08745 [Verrucomicrobiota bacterium]
MKTQSNKISASTLSVLAWLLLCPALPCLADKAAGAAKDAVIFSFATVGDSRYDANLPEATAQDRIWVQHTRPLARILSEIQAQKPAALFFNGDMIMGYTTNAAVLNRQYAYWRGMVAGLLESGTYVVPIPGNHEMQIKIELDGVTDKVAQAASENAWRANMGDLILDTNRWQEATGSPIEGWNSNHAPTIGGPDGNQTDQRQLSYSFDCRGLHFCMLNTDSVGHDSHAPIQWMAADLKAARERGNRRFFVFGHKMAFTYHFSQAKEGKAKGLDIFPEERDVFWKLIEEYGATYFCGHQHIYHAMQPHPEPSQAAWQIIAGSGGSPFEAKPGESKNPNDRKYVWVLVNVFKSGRVTMQAHGFDDAGGPTETIESLELAPGDRLVNR